MKTDIKIEDHVKCKYTGIKGIVMSKTEFVNGCIQFGLAQKFNPTASIDTAMAEFNIDSQSLIITKKGPRHKEKGNDEDEFIGGPSIVKMRAGY